MAADDGRARGTDLRFIVEMLTLSVASRELRTSLLWSNTNFSFILRIDRQSGWKERNTPKPSHILVVQDVTAQASVGGPSSPLGSMIFFPSFVGTVRRSSSGSARSANLLPAGRCRAIWLDPMANLATHGERNKEWLSTHRRTEAGSSSTIRR